MKWGGGKEKIEGNLYCLPYSRYKTNHAERVACLSPPCPGSSADNDPSTGTRGYSCFNFFEIRLGKVSKDGGCQAPATSDGNDWSLDFLRKVSRSFSCSSCDEVQGMMR